MLPKNLRYGNKIESSPSRSSRVNIAPQNGTNGYSATNGDTIIINIPTRNNLCLVPTESYLKFTSTLTSNAASNVLRLESSGAHQFIQRIRIFSGSNLLEDISEYGLLAKMLFDIQCPTDATYGKYNILAGTRADLITNLPTLTAVSGADVTALITSINTNIQTALNNGTRSAVQVNSGISCGTLASGATYTETYCLNLISIIGTLCNTNYFPLFACSSAPLRAEIQLQDNINKCLSASGDASLVLNNVEYVANFVELSDSAMSMVYGALGGQPLQFVVPSYRNYQFSASLAQAQTQINFAIPAKFSSLRSLFVMTRDKLTGASTFFPSGCCTKQITDYYFRVGSQIIPTKAPSNPNASVNGYGEFFSELLKAVGSMSDLNHHPSIEKSAYTLQDSVANNAIGSVSSGSFFIGIDLEAYANADKSTLFAGYNSNTDDIFCVMNFAAQTAATTVRFDSFALFDAVLVFENNTAYIKF